MQGMSIRPADAQARKSFDSSTESDVRLKRDVVRIGTHSSGCAIYCFKYLWSDVVYVGMLAQDVLEHAPDAVVARPGGYLAVNCGALGMTMHREEAQAA